MRSALSGRRGPVFDTQFHLPVAELYKDGVSRKRIAIRLGRTEWSVKKSIEQLRVKGALPTPLRIQWPVPQT